MSNKMKFGMKPKKLHEVEKLASFITNFIDIQVKDNHWVVDFGAGQGYLSSLLHYSFGFNVLSVDGDENQTHGSIDRAKKINFKLKNNNKKNWIHTNKLVGNDSLAELTSSIDKTQNTPKFSICGLHACGDLSATMLKLFVNDQTIQSCINCSCCYQLLSVKEEVEGSKFSIMIDIS